MKGYGHLEIGTKWASRHWNPYEDKPSNCVAEQKGKGKHIN